MLLTTGKYAGEQERSVQSKNSEKSIWRTIWRTPVSTIAHASFLGSFILIRLLIHPPSQDTHDATPQAQFLF